MPNLTTLHGRLDLPELAVVYKQFPDMPLVSISNAQRKPLPVRSWRATVYHGLPDELYSFEKRSGKYLAFIGVAMFTVVGLLAHRFIELLRQVHELVLQLRGQAGDRQVQGDPRVGYAQVYGAPGIAAVTILAR